MSKLDWKRRSSELKKIDVALGEWHLDNNGHDAAAKLAAINKLWYAIQFWQAQKKEGGLKAQRDPAVVVLQEKLREERCVAAGRRGGDADAERGRGKRRSA